MRPQPKVAAGGATAGITILLVWIATLCGLDVPPEVASAFTAILATAASYLKS